MTYRRPSAVLSKISKMKPHWRSIACCITMLVVFSNVAAMPTQDTLVVAKSEEVTEATAATEETTEEPNRPIKLTEMRVRSEVSLRYAVTAVVTHVRNPARRAQEATFHVLLPETAFISEFVMTLNGKSYKAYVKEKAEAKKIYSAAVSQGLGAAHIATKARDSNHFTVSVNVEPNTEAVFNLTYEELLVRRIGVYNHAINLHPGALVPKMEVTVHIKESQKISLLRVPEVRTGNEIDATENDPQNTKVVIQKSHDDKEATITFTPDLEEQTRLMHIYAQKTRESSSSRPSWYSSQHNEESMTSGLGQFVVQYDVDRPENGEILVNDGYFVHFFAPQSLKPLSKLAVFVLDTSSSMYGRKIEQMRDAMRAILADLHPTDYFSIVEFNSYIKVHKLSEAQEESAGSIWGNSWDESDVPVALVPPSPATPDNIQKAQVIVSRFSATGGTNIYKALDVGLDIINKAYTKYDADRNMTTEVRINDELQPIIIFLTDGEATSGETDSKRIISYITEKNSGERKAAIYSLAFGHDADRDLLRKLSLRNEGFMRQIYEATDAALQLRHFYQQVSSPLLAHVNFVYPPEQVKADSVTRHAFVTMFAGAEVVVAGELAPAAHELAPRVTAFCADDNHGKKRYEISNKVEVREKTEYLPLERLWAYLSIKQLLDKRDAQDQDAAADENSPEKRALAIALKYSFVTPLTSLVVVKPNATNAVDAESVDKSPHSSPSFSYPSSFSTFAASRPTYFNSGASFDSVVPLSGLSGPADRSSLMASAYAPSAAGNWALGNYAYRLEEDSYDWGYSNYGLSNHFAYRPRPGRIFVKSFRPHKFRGPPAPTTDVPLSTTTKPLEETYHLQGFSWALSLINSNTDSLEFSANGQNFTLELSKSNEAPKESVDSECAHSAGARSQAGLCVYLTRCAAARSIGLDEFRDTYCLVDNKYAGVCCPRNAVDNPKYFDLDLLQLS